MTMEKLTSLNMFGRLVKFHKQLELSALLVERGIRGHWTSSSMEEKASGTSSHSTEGLDGVSVYLKDGLILQSRLWGSSVGVTDNQTGRKLSVNTSGQ